MQKFVVIHIALMVLSVSLVVTAAIIARRKKAGWLKNHKPLAITGACSALVGFVVIYFAKTLVQFPPFQLTACHWRRSPGFHAHNRCHGGSANCIEAETFSSPASQFRPDYGDSGYRHCTIGAVEIFAIVKLISRNNCRNRSGNCLPA